MQELAPGSWRSWSPELYRDFENNVLLQREHYICEPEQDDFSIFFKREQKNWGIKMKGSKGGVESS